MESLNIPLLPSAPAGADEIGNLLDKYRIAWHRLRPNWVDDYPYVPEARFRLAASGNKLLADYEVSEDNVRAVTPEDNGKVWEDSCCELFLQPGDGHYYNFECNCAGRLLIGCGKGRNDREAAPQSVSDTVKRYASLGSKPFDTRKQSEPWRLSLIIPTTALFKDTVTSWSGLKIKGNVYKCGDNLPRPHFLSWMTVGTKTPDFHRPDFFGSMIVE